MYVITNFVPDFMNDMILEKRISTVRSQSGDDVVSGLMFADNFVGILGTAEGLQEQIEKAQEYTRKWRVTANVNRCAILVCNEDEKKPVEFKW